MYKYFVAYIANTGLITKKGMIPNDESVELQAGLGESTLEITEEKYKTVDSTQEYVANGQFLPREISPITQTGPLSFSNIPYQVPAKAFVTIEGTKYEITEDHLDLEITFPGTYIVLFESFPYKERRFVVEVI